VGFAYSAVSAVKGSWRYGFDTQPSSESATIDHRERSVTMLPIQRFSSSVIADVIRRQPSSPARTTLAWQLAVGTALARATSVALHDGVLTVQSSDARWTAEITRARDIVLGRMQHYLGPGNVKTLRIEKEAARSRGPSS
jgi:predicted nucleic acid-binding Zn ribbon protein